MERWQQRLTIKTKFFIIPRAQKRIERRKMFSTCVPVQWRRTRSEGVSDLCSDLFQIYRSETFRPVYLRAEKLHFSDLSDFEPFFDNFFHSSVFSSCLHVSHNMGLFPSTIQGKVLVQNSVIFRNILNNKCHLIIFFEYCERAAQYLLVGALKKNVYTFLFDFKKCMLRKLPCYIHFYSLEL